MAWTSPRTWVAGEKPPATTMNTHIRDNFNAIGAAWTSYTPAVTGWSLGNGTVSGTYIAAGKLIMFRAKITAGSTTTFTATLALSLPPSLTPSTNVMSLLGQAVLTDTSAGANVFGACRLISGAAQVVYNNAAATNITGAATTSPWTWATTDTVEITGCYEAA